MRTEELIRALATDGTRRPMSLGKSVALALAAGVPVSVATLLIGIGFRPDIMDVIETWRFDFKFVVTLALAMTAAVLALRLSRPGAATRAAKAATLIAPALLATAVVYELAVIPRQARMDLAIGTNAVHCLLLIPLFSAPILAALLYALKRGAPGDPGMAGMAAGLFASGIGAAIYALQCTDDSPLFLAVWYTIAIALVALTGVLAGRRVLRW